MILNMDFTTYYPRTCMTVPLVTQYLKIIPTMVKSAVQLDCYLYFLSEIGIYFMVESHKCTGNKSMLNRNTRYRTFNRLVYPGTVNAK